jgi:CheY-like chemotaxis protein
MNSEETARPDFRILAVDDNRAIHDDLRKILAEDTIGMPDLLEDEELIFSEVQTRATVFELDSAYQGQEALVMVNQAMAQDRPYAVAFVDIRMPPGWDGVETILQLWGADPNLQVVICTAYSDYSWKDIVRVLGKCDSLVILKKPLICPTAGCLTNSWNRPLPWLGEMENWSPSCTSIWTVSRSSTTLWATPWATNSSARWSNG